MPNKLQLLLAHIFPNTDRARVSQTLEINLAIKGSSNSESTKIGIPKEKENTRENEHPTFFSIERKLTTFLVITGALYGFHHDFSLLWSSPLITIQNGGCRSCMEGNQ